MGHDELRKIIHQRFRSESELARALGWSKQKLSLTLLRKRDPSISEVVAITNMIGANIADMAFYFLPEASTNGAENER